MSWSRGKGGRGFPLSGFFHTQLQNYYFVEEALAFPNVLIASVIIENTPNCPTLQKLKSSSCSNPRGGYRRIDEVTRVLKASMQGDS